MVQQNNQLNNKKQLYVKLPYTPAEAEDVKNSMLQFTEHVNNLSSMSVQAGGLYDGTIKEIDGDNVRLSIGKYDVSVPKSQLPDIDQGKNTVPIYVEKVSNELKVNLDLARDMSMWEKFKDFKQKESIVVCRVKQVVHCGYMVELYKQCQPVSQEVVLKSLDGGTLTTKEFDSANANDYVNAFLPHSQCINSVKENDKIYVVILNIDSKKKNIIVSSKKVVFSVKKTHQEQLFDLAAAALKKGDKIVAEVVVTNVVEFGIFAKVMSVVIKDKDDNVLASVDNLNGCIDGLLHVSEISWKRDNKLNTMKYASGDKITVGITEIDREKSRVHFSFKSLQSNPWEVIEKKAKVGQVYKGCTVSGVLERNLLINIPNIEIEGFVEAKEISWNKDECDVYKQFVVGMKVDVMVIAIDVEKEKLFLSIKKVGNMGNLVALKKKFVEQDNVVTGQVLSITHNALLLELESGLQGIVLEEYLHWDINQRNLRDYKIGQQVKCKIVVFNEYTEQIILGVKQLEKDPIAEEYDKLVEGEKYSCIVSNVQYSSIMVKINGGTIDGSIHYSQLSNDKKNRSTAVYKVGQQIEARVLEINRDIGIVRMTLLEEE